VNKFSPSSLTYAITLSNNLYEDKNTFTCAYHCSSCYTHIYNLKQNPNNVTWHLVWIDEIYNQCKCVKSECVKSELSHPQVERNSHYNRSISNRNNTFFHGFHHHKRNAILHKMFLI
jgi:hypothetical protein